MPAMNFPANPILGAEYIFNNTKYIYDGVKWVAQKSNEQNMNQLLDSHKTGVDQHSMSGVQGLNTAISVLQNRLTELESWPKSPKISDIFTVAAGWSAADSEFTVAETATHYQFQGIFRRSTGGVAVGSFKRSVSLTYPQGMMLSGGNTTPIYFDSLSGLGPLSSSSIPAATWVMATILAKKT